MLDSVSDTLLVQLYVLLGAHGARADCHVVTLRKNPRVKIGRHVVPDIHLGEVVVVLHFVVGQLDSLLESDGARVRAGVDGASDTAVGSVGADDDVDGESVSRVVGGVVNNVRGSGGFGEFEVGDEAGDQFGAERLGA